MKNQNIIKKNYHFQRIINNKRFINSKSFVIYYKNKSENNFMYGISVGKKIGNSVLRNKLKRQIRHMIKKCFDKIKNKQIEAVIIAKSFMLQKTFDQNYKYLKTMLEAIK